MELLFGVSTLILGGILVVLYIEYKYIKTKLLDILDVFKIGKEVNIELEHSKLIKQIIQMGSSKLEAKMCALYLMDEEKKELYLDTSLGERAYSENKGPIKLGEGIVGLVALNGETINLKQEAKSEGSKRKSYEKDLKEQMILALPVKIKNKVVGVLEFVNKENGKAFTEEDEELMEMLVELQIAPNLDKSRTYEELRKTFVECISGMASTIESQDIYGKGHCVRVAQKAVRLGRGLGLKENELKNLEYASILHDVGKAKISDFIRSKKTLLTDEENDEIKKHPIFGSEILRQMDSLDESVRLGVQYHHEQYNGQGYPEGLKGEEIPLFARIIAVSDTYDNLRTDTVYRKGVKTEEALVTIKRAAGTYFDPKIVDVFNKIMLEKEE